MPTEGDGQATKQGTLVRSKDYNLAKLVGLCSVGVAFIGKPIDARIGALASGGLLLVLGVYASRKAGDGYV
jgi:hypothetical protein